MAPKHHLESAGTADSNENRATLSYSDETRLSEEQQTVFNLVVNRGESVFFTGAAGTGKSVLLRKIVQSLVAKYLGDRDCIGVTASTGLAAQNIGGTTLHRFTGIGLGEAPTKKLIKDIVESKIKLKRWMDVRVLIIDEISMIDCVLFDKLDAIARAVRETDEPFGGIQLVLSGDFFQLPPVRKGADDGSPKFCFESKSWNRAIRHTINLTQIYRQRDPEFTTMLNQVREGSLSPATVEKFGKLHRPVQHKGVEATELFPLRREADRANLRRLQDIDRDAHKYIAEDGGTIKNPDIRKMLLSDCIAPKYLTLKVGAQVMLTQNIDQTLVNGSQGCVIDFCNTLSFLHTSWEDGNTHHNSDEVTDKLLPLYPVVLFTMRDGKPRIHHCEPVEWAVERWLPKPWETDGWVVNKLATRVQVPLILAWALSIHKAQGQTLDRVKVDLERVFETGQAYVALSRTRSIEGLQVLNFDPSKVAVHPKAKAFYESLSKKTGK
ncbi:Ff.00g006820.m01.CDS01 [Fusarium sp. VM40]|nr:Ff.00g006820.m01.CDS01 [Fusarium sp. VM40]